MTSPRIIASTRFTQCLSEAPYDIKVRVLSLIEELDADPFPDGDRKVSIDRPPAIIHAINDGVVIVTYYIRDNADGRFELLGFSTI